MNGGQSVAEKSELPPRRPEHIERTEIIISGLLRGGVSISFVVVVLGTIIMLLRHREMMGDPAELKHLTSGGGSFPTDVAGVWRGILEGRGRPLIMAGLLMLIATPVVRVAASIVTFLMERDRVFVILTSMVFGLLILSFYLGHAE